jgi:hypothetical protein
LKLPESKKLIIYLLAKVDEIYINILTLIKTCDSYKPTDVTCTTLEYTSKNSEEKSIFKGKKMNTIINELIINFFNRHNVKVSQQFNKSIKKYTDSNATKRTTKRLELLQNYIKTQANSKLGLTYRILGRGGSKTRQRKSKSSKKHSRKTKKSRKG